MNVLVTPTGPAERTLGDQYRRFRDAFGQDPLAAMRDAAFSAFAATGLPTRRNESWHYTDLRALLRDSFEPASSPDADALARAKAALQDLAPSGGRIVLVDGTFVPAFSDVSALGPHVSVTPVLEALASGSIDSVLRDAEALGAFETVVALNAALLRGGVEIAVAPGTKVEVPIEVVSVVSGRNAASVHARSYVRLGAHASATLVEHHVALGDAPSQGHHVLVLAVEDGAALEHVAVLEGLGARTLHVATVLARLQADARLFSLTLVATGGVTRRQSFLEFVGEASEAHFRGVSLLGDGAHADNTLVVTHTAPGCVSRELYKHILDGEATGVFQGKVVVAPGAQKTDGKMLSKAIFLDEGGSMFNKPELEIFADDVVCGHGATAGSLDENQLFYLRARGIPMRQARAMLLEAFAADVIDGVSSEAVASDLTARIGRWLHGHGG